MNKLLIKIYFEKTVFKKNIYEISNKKQSIIFQPTILNVILV